MSFFFPPFMVGSNIMVIVDADTRGHANRKIWSALQSANQMNVILFYFVCQPMSDYVHT